MSEITEVLIKVKEFFNTPDKWIKDDINKIHLGKVVAACTIGAINFVCIDNNIVSYNGIVNRFKHANKIETTIATWNDEPTRTFNEIIDALDRAIEYSTGLDDLVASVVSS